MTRFALKLLCWTLETYNVIWISTLLRSLLVLVNILGINDLLVMALPVTCIILVTGWSRLCKGFPLLVHAYLEVCTLMSHQIDLIHLGGSNATCMMCLAVILELSIFFGSCLTLLAGNLSRSMLLSLIVLETNSSSFKKNQKMFLWRILAVSWGNLAKATWVCTALYHSSTDLFPCQKLVSKSILL